MNVNTHRTFARCSIAGLPRLLASVLLIATPIGVLAQQKVIATASSARRVAEEWLRKQVLVGARPVVAREGGADWEEGVGVAEIRVSARGDVLDVNVLEAPTLSLESAIVSALSTWRFRPETGKSERVGKITFYFVTKDGKSVALNPSEAGYVGSWPQKPRKTAVRSVVSH